MIKLMIQKYEAIRKNIKLLVFDFVFHNDIW